MRIAQRAGYGGPLHTKTGVVDVANVLRCNRLPEAGPARSRFKLRLRTEQRVVAADAAVKTFVVQVPIFPAEGELRIRMARDIERICRKLLTPLLVTLHHCGNTDLLQSLTRVGELHDRDLAPIALRHRRCDKARLAQRPQHRTGNRRNGKSQKSPASDVNLPIAQRRFSTNLSVEHSSALSTHLHQNNVIFRHTDWETAR